MSPRAARGLDRVRPRTPAAPHTAPVTEIRDADGKRALFSVTTTAESAGFGSVTIECSSCGEHSALSAPRGIRALVPSLHLPFLRRDHPSWLRCPACGKFTWVRLSLHL